MTGEAVAASPPGAEPLRAPPLFRRMACFVYEATLLFGLSLIPGALGAFFIAQTGQHHPLQSPEALRVYALVLYGIYFVGFWSRRGQTLAMQTWRIRLVDGAGGRVTQGRALLRYVACCIAWFAPASLAAHFGQWAPWPSLGAVPLGIAGWALLSFAAPGRQFWHDLACGTRLVDARGEPRPAR